MTDEQTTDEAPTEDLSLRYAYNPDGATDSVKATVAAYVYTCANGLTQLCPADDRLTGALAALDEALACYLSPAE